MSVPSEYSKSTAQSSKRTEYANDGGCVVTPSTLFGAAAAVSVGISTVLEQISGLTDTVTTSGRPSKESRSPGRGMRKNSSFRRGKESSTSDAKKEDSTRSDNNLIEEINGLNRELAPSTFAPTGILYNSTAGTNAMSPLRPKSNKVVRITPPRTEGAEGGKNGIASRSPVARMRNESTDSLNPDSVQSSPSRPPPKSPEEVKAEKQRKWRAKMKLAQEQQKLEKRSLESQTKSRRRRSSSGGSRGLVAAIGDHVLGLIDAHCGDVDDVAYVSDSDDSRQDESSTSSEGSRNGKSRKSKHSQRRSGSNGSRGVPSTSPKNKENLQGNDSGTKATVVDGPADGRSPASADMDESRFQVDPNPGLGDPEVPPRRNDETQDQLSDVSNVSSASSEELTEIDHMKAFVHDMVLVGFPFLWQQEMMVMAPKAVVLRLKTGWQSPEGSFCGPRMIWQLDESEAYGINIFDIQTLERASPVQLKDYPFVAPSRTVYVRMNRGQDFVFEAPSEDDAGEFVHGMKSLVASLSFSLVIGNMDAVFELLQVKMPDDLVKTIPRGESRRVIAMDDLAQELLHRSFFP